MQPHSLSILVRRWGLGIRKGRTRTGEGSGGKARKWLTQDSSLKAWVSEWVLSKGDKIMAVGWQFCWEGQPKSFSRQWFLFLCPFLSLLGCLSSWAIIGKGKKLKVKLLSHVQLFATLWTVAHQAPPSMGFSRQEYWSRLPFPSPGALPDPGIEPGSLWATREAHCQRNHILYMPLCTWWWKIPVVREPWAGDPGEMSQEHSVYLRDISVCKNNSNNWKSNCSQSLSFLFYFHLLNKYLLSGYHGTSAIRWWRIQ